ncbi:hypothetical protein XENTR_v10011420 [Xenopus tropicalis]|nr:hypothetical protein XENTR_v10011420 [Xenopus tropicalis]
MSILYAQQFAPDCCVYLGTKRVLKLDAVPFIFPETFLSSSQSSTNQVCFKIKNKIKNDRRPQLQKVSQRKENCHWIKATRNQMRCHQLVYNLPVFQIFTVQVN